MYKWPILLYCLSLVFALAAQTTISYTISNEDFLNPERGFYYASSTRWDPDSDNYDLLSPNWVASRRVPYTPSGANYEVTSSLFFRYFMLRDFVDQPISEAYLDNMAFDFASIRAAGSKAIVRFSYTNEQQVTAPFGDAPKAQVLQHLQQLAPVLQANADVIATVQLGFIGTWGEGYYTDYFGFAGPEAEGGQVALFAQNWRDRNELIQALLDILPPDRSIQVRYAQQNQKYADGVAAPTTSTASTPRIGFHNDCFLASDFDFGTYTNYDPWTPAHNDARSDLRTYKAANSLRVPVGGETCFLNTQTPIDVNCSADGGRADSDLALFHYDFLNSDYNNDVNNNWTGVCLDDIKHKLGYRFELIDGVYPDAAQPGQQLDLQLNVRNVGYSVPYNPRGLEYVLRHTTSGEIYFVSPASDPQNWLPNSTTTLDQTFCLPADMPTGNYDLLLHLPDPYPSLYGRPDYAIRLANSLPGGSDVWEAATGYNRLGHTININNTAAGTNCDGEATFAALSSILPVQWQSFYANLQTNNAVKLSWTTAVEDNNRGFHIERSLDGKTFTSIGWQYASAAADFTYTFRDQHLPAAPLLHYRLQQVDWDGRYSYSDVARVRLPAKPGSLTVFPNPSRGGRWFRYSTVGPSILQLYNSQGMLLWEGQHNFAEGDYLLDQLLPPGMYQMVVLVNRTQTTATFAVH